MSCGSGKANSPQVKPVKRAGGRRYYRPADLALLGGIKKLLHEDGLTIRGVQKILKEKGVRHVAALSNVDLARSDTTESGEAANVATKPASAGQRGDAGHWPASPPPDVAAEGDNLVPDPDDAAAQRGDPASEPGQPRGRSISPGAEQRAELGRQRNNAPEAPMQVDVPTLPRENGGQCLTPWHRCVTVWNRSRPAPPRPRSRRRPIQPAAAMLRAHGHAARTRQDRAS